MPGMIHAESRYRAITAQAWSGMLMVELAMSVTEAFEFLGGRGSSVNPTALVTDACLISLNCLVQVAVRTFDGPSFRKLVFWISLLYMAFFILDHVIMASQKSLPDTILYFTHHVLGMWAVGASWAWSSPARAHATAGDVTDTAPAGSGS